MSRRIDPVARAVEAYRAVPKELKAATDYLLLREIRGEALVLPTPRVGRPVGSKNRQKSAPLIEQGADA